MDTTTKGMACLSQYRAARRQAGEHVLPEIDFNFGRAFQQLGGRQGLLLFLASSLIGLIVRFAYPRGHTLREGVTIRRGTKGRCESKSTISIID